MLSDLDEERNPPRAKRSCRRSVTARCRAGVGGGERKKNSVPRAHMLCLMFRRWLVGWQEETGPSQEHRVSTRPLLQQVHVTGGFKVGGGPSSQVQTLVASGGCFELASPGLQPVCPLTFDICRAFSSTQLSITGSFVPLFRTVKHKKGD